MKKDLKKLVLHRETLHRLEETKLREALGGGPTAIDCSVTCLRAKGGPTAVGC